ncbi:adenylyl-sulfate kinase [Paenibacillus sp. QZ-Y1]|uniref:adenylyl-sulfate kinase n=1 Tax=Paenibacillus sp. QZ-Y1 TaxID=3414511 RepID=UPI003F7A0558
MTRSLILIEGLPGSGKSTIAKMVSEILIQKGKGLYWILMRHTRSYWKAQPQPIWMGF